MSSKLLGGVLLIVGTAIGGGMLALPATVAPGGFFNAVLFLFFCWAVMTFSSFLILEVNLWLPPHTNIISMARTTLGRTGEMIAWVTYLLLLYSLIAAYTSSGTDVLDTLFTKAGWHLPFWVDSVLFLSVIGFLVYCGIRTVDYVNRILMLIKFTTYFLLVGSILPHIELAHFSGGKPQALIGGLTVLITSYGFGTIIPSLRAYYQDDIKKLRLAVLIGSFIPLIFYILWVFCLLGVVPTQGTDGLLGGHRATSELTLALSHYLRNAWISKFSEVFTSVCVATSFLGVSVGLVDFLSDGLQIKKESRRGWIVFAAAFLPPLIAILIKPDIFVIGLSYSGACCIVLLMLLPALMAWSGRYVKKIAQGYEVMGGKLGLITVMCMALGIIISSVAL